MSTGEPFDVFMTGPLFFDMVFTGLPSAPEPGTEVFTEGMGSLPGGIANLAVATARLGLSTSLAAGFGDDVYGAWCRTVLAHEGVDLSRSRTVSQHTSVTVSMSYDGDRAMVTHGHDLPMSADELIGVPPPAAAVIMDLTPARLHEKWWRAASSSGARVFADVGWDETGRWPEEMMAPLEVCEGFSPNSREAMAYTRTDSPEAALAALSERVPLAVVTLGPEGAIARDSGTGEEARSAALPFDALDPTGAGDNFMSALVYGRLQGWPLQQVLDFAVLCSGLSVTQFGGSLSAPGWGDVASWHDHVTGRIAAGAAPRCECLMHVLPNFDLAKRYSFLDDVVPAGPLSTMRRAAGTFAIESDPAEHGTTRLSLREWGDLMRARRKLRHPRR